ncbi:hypothetical protein BWI97_15890 [Siphonobacter sp. BAB-5405]|uniref:helix-turn-helix domain-containing protein n=1 Tax=Siphonobacter sp. BAB-5405 TaxID=1864825 RepID=UPI000C80DF4E|nr:helix-turn-helix domain-containing protein [Siphonobacter sp. BAB-5405]PMD94877.1 hypothetical protein BWI97_15890 [Siphonobacter sp. BAB-5405]
MNTQIIVLQPHELQDMLKLAAHEAIREYKSTFPDSPQQKVFTAEEAAEYLRFFTHDGKPNARAINTLRKSGELEGIQNGGAIRYTLEQLQAYLRGGEPIKNPLTRSQRVSGK